MIWPVTIRPRAKADLRHAHDWYEARCPGLGAEFLAAHAEALSRPEADPERYPPYYRGFRRVLTHRFPYKILFGLKAGTSLSSASCTARKTTGANWVRRAGREDAHSHFSRSWGASRNAKG